jgi:hypothetical protein
MSSFKGLGVPETPAYGALVVAWKAGAGDFLVFFGCREGFWARTAEGRPRG